MNQLDSIYCHPFMSYRNLGIVDPDRTEAIFPDQTALENRRSNC